MDMTRNEVVRLARDVRKNNVSGNYSMDQAHDTLYRALVDANGGKKHLDPRDIRDGKCSELFAIVEEIITEVKHDILSEDPFFKEFVEYRNYEFGDKPEFELPNDELFVVSEIASGSQALRRQRLTGGNKFTVNTSWKGIKVYEEIELLLAGRVDFNNVIDRVARSFAARVNEDIYAVWNGAIEGLAEPYLVTGTFTEFDMVELIQHVKAANASRAAYIMGTLMALNRVVSGHDNLAQVALESRYFNGFTGMFNGTPKVEIMQMYKAGTTEFALDDNVVNVFASSVKPIMYITEGKSLIIPHSFAENTDMTQEYLMMEKTGIAARVPDGEGKFGRYIITG